MYFTKWDEVKMIESYTKETITKFIYENMVERFGCPLTIISDEGTHFVNRTIKNLLKKLIIYHRKTLTYHPQDIGVVESFNNTIHKEITKTLESIETIGVIRSLQYFGLIGLHIKDGLVTHPSSLYMPRNLKFHYISGPMQLG
jgi:transposase InsO family protein